MQRRGMATLVRSAMISQEVNLPTKATLLTRITRTGVKGAKWNSSHLLHHTGAVAQGLLEVARTGDTIASLLGNTSERVALQLGAASAGMRVVDSGPGISSDALKKMLKEQNVKVLVLSPEIVNSCLYNAVPELQQIALDSAEPLKLAQFPGLKYVYQTGLGPMNGTYRFKDSLVYYPLVDKVENLSSLEDSPVFATVDPKTGDVKEELTQKQLLEKSAALAKEAGVVHDVNVLFKAKESEGIKLLAGALACQLNAAQLVVPGEIYDEQQIAMVKANDGCTAQIA